MPLRNLKKTSEKIARKFDKLNLARDKAIITHREVIRLSSLAIKSAHREEFSEAERFVKAAKKKLSIIQKELKNFPEIYYAGFLFDCEKEYAEAKISLSLIRGKNLPDPDSLGVDYVSYLNGLGEAIGELRRHILDTIRTGKPKSSETLLAIMDEIFCFLMSFDYPDAVTRGLRRNTDIARSLVEKTRGDLTAHLRQIALEKSLKNFEKGLKKRLS